MFAKGQSATFETEVVRLIGSQQGRSAQSIDPSEPSGPAGSVRVVVQHCAATDPQAIVSGLAAIHDCRSNSGSSYLFLLMYSANAANSFGMATWHSISIGPFISIAEMKCR